MKYITSFVIGLLLILGGFMESHAGATEFSNVISNILQDKTRRNQIDVTAKLGHLFPTRTTSQETITLLSTEGFDIIQPRNLTDTIIGTKKFQSDFIGYNEIRIIIKLESDRIQSLQAFLFRHQS